MSGSVKFTHIDIWELVRIDQFGTFLKLIKKISGCYEQVYHLNSQPIWIRPTAIVDSHVVPGWEKRRYARSSHLEFTH